MEKILCVGDIAIEMILPMKTLPPIGTVLDEERYRFLPGGSCGNAALAMAFFGMKTAIASRVGKDGNAARLVNFFSANGIDTDGIATEPTSQTALTTVLAESDGTIRTLRYRGAAEKITAQDVDGAIANGVTSLYLTREISAYIATHAVTVCEEKGISLSIDASEERLLRALSLKGAKVKLLYTAAESVRAFTDMPISDVNSALKATLVLGQKIKADGYVIRLDNGGLFLYDGKTYNMVMLSDYARVKPTAAYADIQSAVLTALYLKTASLYQSVGIAAVADLLSREGRGARFATPDACRDYIRRNNLPFSL